MPLVHSSLAHPSGAMLTTNRQCPAWVLCCPACRQAVRRAAYSTHLRDCCGPARIPLPGLSGVVRLVPGLSDEPRDLPAPGDTEAEAHNTHSLSIDHQSQNQEPVPFSSAALFAGCDDGLPAAEHAAAHSQVFSDSGATDHFGAFTLHAAFAGDREDPASAARPAAAVDIGSLHHETDTDRVGWALDDVPTPAHSLRTISSLLAGALPARGHGEEHGEPHGEASPGPRDGEGQGSPLADDSEEGEQA
jgi:hypothetical protein